MRSFYPLILVFLVAFLFYGLIPGIGAFSTRSSWRLFRKQIGESSLFPFLGYSDLSRQGTFLGCFRIFGNLEAIQGKSRIWINNGSFAVEVDLEATKLYFLPSFSAAGIRLPLERLEDEIPDEQPAAVSWDQIFSLPAGTRMFVAGSLFSEEGRAVFRTQAKEPLLVVLYDGDRSTILQRAIWGGRQKNEYWNQFTVASLLTGSFCMLLLAYVFMRSTPPGLPSLIALALAFFPICGLLPPGFVLYYLYRYFWKRARLLRAERDLLRLPLRYYPQGFASGRPPVIQLPSGEPYLASRTGDLLMRGELTIRSASLPSHVSEQAGSYVLFGAHREGNGESWIETPRDPMAELVLVLGDPAALADACDRRARLFEYLATLCVFLALSVNLILVTVIWHLILR